MRDAVRPPAMMTAARGAQRAASHLIRSLRLTMVVPYTIYHASTRLSLHKMATALSDQQQELSESDVVAFLGTLFPVKDLRQESTGEKTARDRGLYECLVDRMGWRELLKI